MEDILKKAIEFGLTREEYFNIKKILGHEPNLVELGVFSVLWSEHCSYKSSKIYLKKLPTKNEHTILGPGENAGIVSIDDELALCFKMESHNHPSFIEPFQGAATGVGGILRDIFTMGARPVALLNSLRFGDVAHERTNYLVDRVVAGIAAYGNCVGVPTVGGEVYFDEAYNENILVNVFCMGVVKKNQIKKASAYGVGNPVLYVGSKTGRDGIHGATMASVSFDENSDQKRPTVQVADPFTEKLLIEACHELFKHDYIVGIQDMGAAGLTCSTFEMADRGKSGMEIDLDKVPQREENMTAYEILLSESQERMLIVVKKGFEEKVIEIFKKWDLDAVVVGKVNDDPCMTIKYKDETHKIPIRPCVSEVPLYDRPKLKPSYQDELSKFDFSESKEKKNLNEVLQKLVSSPTIASKRWIYQQFDYMVGTDTYISPGEDAGLLRIKGKNLAIGVTLNGNATYCYLNPYMGAIISVAECARNLACIGAHPLAITDCLNFGNPENPHVMWQFSEVIDGIIKACKEFNTAVVSGNVSFYNETNNKNIFPSPIIGMVGKIENFKHKITSCFKDSYDLIVLLGINKDEIGGSEYLKQIGKKACGKIPNLDFSLEKSVHKTCIDAINLGILKSAHDCSEGGLAVCLAECCVNVSDLDFVGTKNPIGAKIIIEKNLIEDFLLFSESQSRIVVTVFKDDFSTLQNIALKNNNPISLIGTVGGERLVINNSIDLNINELKESFDKGFERGVFGKS